MVSGRGGWTSLIAEPFSGAWQRNISINRDSVLTFHAVQACLTLISSDIAKLRVKLVARDSNGVWTEVTNSAYNPVLRKPNHFQTRIQFWECWILSKLMMGNTYVLKERDERNVVVRLYVLDPRRVTPLVSDSGDVFYQLNADALSGLEAQVTVPAREIIHDRMNCMYHPLVGLSPITANGLAATVGLNIQNQAAWFFGNKGMPGAILTAPGQLNDETAARLKAEWEAKYTGATAGRVAVLGDGLTYQSLPMPGRDTQLIEQLKWSAEVICSTFHVPPYKIGVGQMPTYNNIQSLNVEYYSQCLQSLIEAAELCLDEGLHMDNDIGTEFDLDGLLRMDTTTQVLSLKEGVGAGIMAPNEARRKLDLTPVAGGDSPFLQQQNFSLLALSKRDAKEDPFSSGKEVAPEPAEADEDEEPDDEVVAETDEEKAQRVMELRAILDTELRYGQAA